MIHCAFGQDNNKKKRGFTIVEILIVVVIVGILAAIVYVSYSGVTRRAQHAALQAEAKQVANSIAAYQAENGDDPTKDEFYCDDGETVGVDCVYDDEGTPGSKVEYDCYEDEYCFYDVLPADNNGGICYTDECAGGTGGTTNRSDTIDIGAPTDCPTGFIPVPGTARYGQKGFCVMKYEAKSNGSAKPVSTESDPVWDNISRFTAISLSKKACDGCHLITESEWMTIAINVLKVSSNWTGGEFGSGSLYKGKPIMESESSERRYLSLSSGSEIWDFIGNAGEMTQGLIELDKQPGRTDDYFESWVDNDFSLFKEYNDQEIDWQDFPSSSRPPEEVADLDYSNGIGRLVSNYNETNSGMAMFIRGNGDDVYGLYALATVFSNDYKQAGIGFRVAK